MSLCSSLWETLRFIFLFWYFCSFQSERETGDRNYAIGYYLKEKKVRIHDHRIIHHLLLNSVSDFQPLFLQCFPDNADMIAALDFYFQVRRPQVESRDFCRASNSFWFMGHTTLFSWKEVQVYYYYSIMYIWWNIIVLLFINFTKRSPNHELFVYSLFIFTIYRAGQVWPTSHMFIE